MENKHIRLANLRQLIRQEGAVSQLALRLQISPIYIYRVLDGKFNIGDSMARKIEDAYGYGHGWMDVQHGDGGAGGQSDRQDVEPTRADIVTAAPSPVPNLLDAPLPRQGGRDAGPSAVLPAVPVGGSVPGSYRPRTTPANEASSIAQRLISGVIRALDRLLAINRVDMTETEKAKLLMKAAEKILDSHSNGRKSGDDKPVRKIS